MSPKPAIIPPGNRTYALLTLLVAVTAAAASVYAILPPAPVPADAPGDTFSAERAFVHIEAIADDIHPIGTQNNAEARDYILETLASMDIEVELQDAFIERGAGTPYRLADATPPFSVSRVQNVIARVEGTLPEAERKAVLLMAHYDGTPYGPGAADDVTGVAAIIESLRALQAGPPLKHDVIGILTDGEEAGLLGPRAFSQHRWYDRVAFVINFEARGHYGPSMMFQVTDDNRWFIEEVGAACDSVVASSTMFDVAKRMPTRSDFWVLRQEGFQGIDVAFVGGIDYYHTQNDSPEMLSLASVQNHGNYGLQISRHLAASDILADVGRLNLDELEGDNAIYFNTFGKHIPHYPAAWAIPLTLGGAVLVLLVIALAWRRGYAELRGILGGVVLQFAVIVIGAALAGLVAYIGFQLHAQYIQYRDYHYLFGMTGLVIAVVTALYGWALKRITAASLFCGALLVWLGALMWLTPNATGATFAALFPMASMAIAFLLVTLLGHGSSPLLRVVLLLAGALTPIVLLAPNIYLFFLSLLVIGAPAYMALLAAGLGLLSPLFVLLGPDGRRWLSRAGYGVAVLFLLIAFWGVSFTPSTPKMNMLCYGVNWDDDEAYWITTDTELDSWMRQYFTTEGETGTLAWVGQDAGREYRLHEAPTPSFAKPAVQVLRDETADGVREVEFRVLSPRLPEYVWLSLPEDVRVLGTTYRGVEMGANDNPWRFRYRGLPDEEDGLHFTLRVADNGDGPLPLTVAEESSALPPIEGVPMEARPANMITENNVIGHFRGGVSSNRVWSKITLTL